MKQRDIEHMGSKREKSKTDKKSNIDKKVEPLKIFLNNAYYVLFIMTVSLRSREYVLIHYFYIIILSENSLFTCQ